MKSRYLIVLLAAGSALLVLAASPSAWAGSGQYQGECGGTVPCQTKVPPREKNPTEEKDKNTPTPAPPTRLVDITPIVVSSATVVLGMPTRTGVIAPASSTLTVTPTVGIMLTMEPATVLPLFTLTLAVAAPTQTATLLPSDTPVPLSTLSSTHETVASNGSWLLWVIGPVLIVGGAALVLTRSREQKR